MEVSAAPSLVAEDFLFTCQPRVFSAKRGERTTIVFGLPKAAEVILKIYNLDGHLQRSMISGETLHAGRNAIFWDGRDDDDRMVPSGLYLIALEIRSGKVETKTVVVQNRQ